MGNANVHSIAPLATLTLALCIPATSVAQQAKAAPVDVRFLGEWVTPATFPGDLQVAHVRVRIATRVPADVRAADFAATLDADGGGTTIVGALPWPSPGYENAELVGIAGTRPDVDPPEDFGAIGGLHLEAGAQAITTLSFELPFAVNGSQPIRSIAYRPAGT